MNWQSEMGRTAIPPRVREGWGYERCMQVENVGLQQVHTSNADGPQRTALPPHYTYERAFTNKVWRRKHPTPLSTDSSGQGSAHFKVKSAHFKVKSRTHGSTYVYLSYCNYLEHFSFADAHELCCSRHSRVLFHARLDKTVVQQKDVPGLRSIQEGAARTSQVITHHSTGFLSSLSRRRGGVRKAPLLRTLLKRRLSPLQSNLASSKRCGKRHTLLFLVLLLCRFSRLAAFFA